MIVNEFTSRLATGKKQKLARALVLQESAERCLVGVVYLVYIFVLHYTRCLSIVEPEILGLVHTATFVELEVPGQGFVFWFDIGSGLKFIIKILWNHLSSLSTTPTSDLLLKPRAAASL